MLFSPRSPSPGAQRLNSCEPRGLLRAQARSSLNREPMAGQPWERDTRLYKVFLVVVVASGLRRADAVTPHAPTASMAATAARRRKWRASRHLPLPQPVAIVPTSCLRRSPSLGGRPEASAGLTGWLLGSLSLFSLCLSDPCAAGWPMLARIAPRLDWLSPARHSIARCFARRRDSLSALLYLCLSLSLLAPCCRASRLAPTVLPSPHLTHKHK